MTGQGPANLEDDIRLEERFAERARIAHELHDKLLQGFLAASMLLHRAVEETSADSPSMPALSRALRLEYVRPLMKAAQQSGGCTRLHSRARVSIRPFRLF